jgi:sigma-B regulation protein RsbU (phosphoserine phosphatase)
MMPDLEFKALEIKFRTGDTLFAFTDGVIDAQNGAGEFFTKDRLLATLEKSFDSTRDLIEAVIKEVYSHISDFTQFDDVTVVAFRRLAANTS